jgi:hypothetical protein
MAASSSAAMGWTLREAARVLAVMLMGFSCGGSPPWMIKNSVAARCGGRAGRCTMGGDGSVQVRMRSGRRVRIVEGRVQRIGRQGGGVVLVQLDQRRDQVLRIGMLAAKASASNSCLREESEDSGENRKVKTGSTSMNSSSAIASLLPSSSGSTPRPV